MKGKCINNENVENLLSLGKEYEILRTSGYCSYWIIDDFGNEDYYNKSRFEIVEEATKIKNILELNQMKFGEFSILIMGGWITVLKNNVSYINFCHVNMDEKKIVSILNDLGIDVEIEREITVTQKATDWLKSLPEYVTKIKYYKKNLCLEIAGEMIPYTSHLFNNLEDGKEYLVADLLKMKIEG